MLVPQYIHQDNRRDYRYLVGLMLSVFIAHLDANLTGPAIYLLEVKTRAPSSTVSSLTSLYFGAEVCGLLVGGIVFLSRDTVRGAKVALWVTVSTLSLSSVIDDIFWLNLLRIAQGGAAGILVVAFLVSVKREAAVAHVPYFVAGNSAATLIAAIAAPVMAATLPLSTGGDWIFAIPVPMALMALLCLPKRSVGPQRDPFGSLSYINMGFLFPLLILLVWALERERGVPADTPFSWWLMAVAFGLCLVGFIATRCALPPSQRFLVLPSPRVAPLTYFALPIAFVSGATIFGSTYLMSYQLVTVHQAGPLTLLTLMLIMAVPQLLLLPLFVWLNKRCSPFLLIGVGALLCALSFFHMQAMSTLTHAPDLMLTQWLRVVGIPLVAMPLTLMVVRGTPAPYIATASALLSVSRMLGGAIGIALPLWYITQRQSQMAIDVSTMMPAWAVRPIERDALFVQALMECNHLWGIVALLISLASFLLYFLSHITGHGGHHDSSDAHRQSPA